MSETSQRAVGQYISLQYSPRPFWRVEAAWSDLAEGNSARRSHLEVGLFPYLLVSISAMKYSFASPLVLLALAGSALAGLEDAAYSVSALSISRRVLALADVHSRLQTVLTSKNFDHVIASQSEGTLVAFFAPWVSLQNHFPLHLVSADRFPSSISKRRFATPYALRLLLTLSKSPFYLPPISADTANRSSRPGPRSPKPLTATTAARSLTSTPTRLPPSPSPRSTVLKDSQPSSSSPRVDVPLRITLDRGTRRPSFRS